MFTCVDCHTDVKNSAHETPPQRITCATCHADEQAAYERSFHAKAVKGRNDNAATCVDCHGSPHELLPASDPKSRVHHSNIPATCGACHSQKFVMDGSGLRVQTVASYEQSVHGHAVANGSEKAAVCTDCHGTHEILDAKDSKSPIFKFNVPPDLRQVPRPRSRKNFNKAFTGRPSPRPTGRRRCAPIVTGSTRSRRTQIPTLRYRRRMSRRPRARAATKVCGSRRSLASKAAARPLIWPATMG